MSNITYNLNRWIATLQKLENSVAPTAFVKTLERSTLTYTELLWGHAEAAANRTKEFNLPEFKEPLKRAIYDPKTIIYNLDGNRIIVTIDLDSTAGNIADYASAIRKVRNTFTPEKKPTRIQASAYWKYYIYGQGREGRKIKKPRKKGQLGRTPLAHKEGTVMYKATITERLGAMGTIAPFWSLIDKGNANVPELDSGGRAYPSVPRTGFVSKAKQAITGRVNRAFAGELKRLTTRLEREQYGENGLLDKIEKAIINFETNVASWSPGDVLSELLLGEKKYNIYVTKTHKLGIRQT